MSLRKIAAVWLAVLLTFLVLVTVTSPLSAVRQDRAHTVSGPSGGHWLGTDLLGRDNLSRLALGGLNSLLIALLATAGIAVVGITVGAVAGYRGGLIDALLTKVTEICAAMPMVLGALIIMAVLGPGRMNMVFAMTVSGWPQLARLTRAAVAGIRHSGYVEASWLMGASDRHVLMAHVIPNTAAPVVLYLLANIGAIILGEAVLSFLGLGIPPPAPSWGNMLSDALRRWPQAPWSAVLPGIAVTLTVAGFMLLGWDAHNVAERN